MNSDIVTELKFVQLPVRTGTGTVMVIQLI